MRPHGGSGVGATPIRGQRRDGPDLGCLLGVARVSLPSSPTPAAQLPWCVEEVQLVTWAVTSDVVVVTFELRAQVSERPFGV